MTVKDLSAALNWSDVTVRKKAKELMSLSLIGQIGEKPALYTIKEGYLDN